MNSEANNFFLQRSNQPEEQRPTYHVSKIMPELWALLSDMERESLMLWSRFEKVDKDGVIFDGSRSPEYLYVLCEGQVKLTQARERPQIVQLVSPSDYFGHVPFLAGVDEGLVAMAIEESLICSYPISFFESILEVNTSVAHFFLKELSQRLWQSYRLLMSLTQKHLRGRPADAILLLRDTFGVEADGVTLKAKFSRSNLSELCNMNRGNVTRTLREMESEGALLRSGLEIKITNLELLYQISKLG